MSDRICKEHSMLRCGSCEEIESLRKENELLMECVELVSRVSQMPRDGHISLSLMKERARECLAKLGER